jgi:hypothetical protein
MMLGGWQDCVLAILLGCVRTTLRRQDREYAILAPGGILRLDERNDVEEDADAEMDSDRPLTSLSGLRGGRAELQAVDDDVGRRGVPRAVEPARVAARHRRDSRVHHRHVLLVPRLVGGWQGQAL